MCVEHFRKRVFSLKNCTILKRIFKNAIKYSAGISAYESTIDKEI